jgi:hypothetical protein
MNNKRLMTIILLLRIGAIVALITASFFAIAMAAFATDDPSSSKTIALIIGLFFFIILAVPATWFPLWAARSVTKQGAHGLRLATVFSLISIIFLFPLGTSVGIILLYQIIKIKIGP